MCMISVHEKHNRKPNNCRHNDLHIPTFGNNKIRSIYGSQWLIFNDLLIVKLCILFLICSQILKYVYVSY